MRRQIRYWVMLVLVFLDQVSKDLEIVGFSGTQTREAMTGQITHHCSCFVQLALPSDRPKWKGLDESQILLRHAHNRYLSTFGLLFLPVIRVIIFVGQDVMNITDLGLVIDRNDQPVLVSASVEDSQILVHIRASKRRSK